MKIRSAVILAGVAAFVAWIAAWFAVWGFALIVPKSVAPRLGQVGDMFGAGSGLFAGVAVAAVAVVLVYDVSERRKDLQERERAIRSEQLELRPYVVGTVGDRDVRIDASHWVSEHLNVTLVLRVKLTNHTADPALNVTLRAEAIDRGVSTPPAAVALPVSVGDLEPTDLALTFAGVPAETALADLLNDSVHVRVDAEYESLNGTGWYSRVTYVLTASDDRVREIIPRLRNRSSGETIATDRGLGGGTVYYVRAIPLPGSWAQEAKPVTESA